MPFHGSVVVIKRSGVDGSVFPLVTESCLLGRNENCDIRVQLPAVAGEHCKISVNENKQVGGRWRILRMFVAHETHEFSRPLQVAITSLSSVPTVVNGSKIKRAIAQVRILLVD